MKKITLKSASHFPQEGKKWQASKQCDGLREYSGALSLSLKPDTITSIPTGHQLEYIDLRHGKELFITSSGSNLWLWAWRNTSGDRTVNSLLSKITSLDGALKNIVSVGNYLIVHTTTGLSYLKYTNLGYTAVHLGDALPHISFSTAGEVIRSASMPALTFPSPVSSWYSKLSVENSDAVKNRMQKALTQLEKETDSQGEFIQPILVRYLVTDKDNNLIYASTPVMVGCGIQGAQVITSAAITNSNSYTGIDSAIFSVKAFGIKMHCHKHTDPQWTDFAAHIHVVISETQSPFTDSCHITLNSMGVGNYSLSASLNTIDAESYAHYSLTSNEWKEIASFSAYDLKSGASHNIYNNFTPDTKYNAEEIGEKTLSFLSEYNPQAIAAYNGMLLRAGGFRYNKAVSNPLELFQGSFSDTPCTAVLTICSNSLDSGETRYSSTFSLPFTPSHISPVFSVPGNAIDSAILQISSASGTYCKSFTLKSYSPAGYCSAINSSLAPVALSFTPGVEIINYPDITSEYLPTEGTITTSEPNSPFATKYRSNIDIGSILGITPINNPVASGIFNHLPLYAFTDTGVYACTYEPITNASRVPRRLSAITIAKFPQTVASTPNATYFSDGLSLFSLASAKCRLVIPEFDAKALQFLHHSNSLIALTNDGDIDIYNSELRCHRVPDIKASLLFALHSGAVIAVTTQNDIIEFSSQNTHSSSAINLRSHPIEMIEKIKSLVWDICGTGLNLQLNIYGMAETVTGLPDTLLASYILQGTSRVPVFTPVDAPFFSRIALEIKGTVSGKISISNITFNPKL